MTEGNLIKKIQELKQIKPRKEWVVLTKNKILGDYISQPQSFFFQFKPVFAGLVIVFILFGVFGLAQYSLPGDFLFPAKKITEKSQAVFVSEEEKPAFRFEIANKRLNDLSEIIETNQVKKIAPAMAESRITKTEAKKEVLSLIKAKPEKAVEIAKQAAPKIKEINEKEKEVLTSLGLEQEEKTDGAEKAVVELLISDLESQSLTENQKEIFEQAKKYFEDEKYSLALEKVLILSYPQE